MEKNITYYKSIQNAYGLTSKKDANIAELKHNISSHFADSTDYEPNTKVDGVVQPLIVIATTQYNIKKIIAYPTSSIKIGQVVECYGEKYLITEIDANSEVYPKGKMTRCNYALLFQLPTDYSIVSVPCITSNKSFNNDESKVITLSDNKKSILCARTADTLTLKTDRRLYVDIRNETPYIIEGDIDTTTYNFGEHGLLSFIVAQSQVQITDGDLPKDRPDLGICNYHEPVVVPPIPVGLSYSNIVVSGDLLIGSTRARTLTVTTFNSDDTINTDAVITWTFVYPVNYESLFTVTYPTNRTAKIMCGNTDDYDKLVGKFVNVGVSDGSDGFVGKLDVKIRM